MRSRIFPKRRGIPPLSLSARFFVGLNPDTTRLHARTIPAFGVVNPLQLQLLLHPLPFVNLANRVALLGAKLRVSASLRLRSTFATRLAAESSKNRVFAKIRVSLVSRGFPPG